MFYFCTLPTHSNNTGIFIKTAKLIFTAKISSGVELGMNFDNRGKCYSFGSFFGAVRLMDETILVHILSNVGIPAALCFYTLFSVSKNLEKLTEAVKKFLILCPQASTADCGATVIRLK